MRVEGGGWRVEERESHLVDSLADPDGNTVEHLLVVDKCGSDEGVVECLGRRCPCLVVLRSRAGREGRRGGRQARDRRRDKRNGRERKEDGKGEDEVQRTGSRVAGTRLAGLWST